MLEDIKIPPIPVPDIEYDHSSIVLCDIRSKGIANENGIPWDIPEDKEFFRKIIQDPKYLPVCGTRTFLDLPDWMRQIFVPISSNLAVKNLDDAISLAESQGRFVLVCGGERLYDEAFKNNKIKYFIENYILYGPAFDFTRFYKRDALDFPHEVLIKKMYGCVSTPNKILNLVIRRL